MGILSLYCQCKILEVVNPISDFLLPLLTALGTLIGIIAATSQLSAMALHKKRAIFWRTEAENAPSRVSTERALLKHKEALGKVFVLESIPLLLRAAPLWFLLSGMGISILLGIAIMRRGLGGIPAALYWGLPFSMIGIGVGCLLIAEMRTYKRSTLSKFITDDELIPYDGMLVLKKRAYLYSGVTGFFLPFAIIAMTMDHSSIFTDGDWTSPWAFIIYFASAYPCLIASLRLRKLSSLYIREQSRHTGQPASSIIRNAAVPWLRISQKRKMSTFRKKINRETVSGKP